MKLWEYPNINDVTTNPDDAPTFVTLARRQPDVFRQKVDPLFGPPLAPQQFPDDADEVFLRVEQVVARLDWEAKRIDRDARILEAVDTTKVLRFKDDIIVEVSDDSVVKVRSRSRVGRKDFGVNEKRIRRFQSLLEQN